MGSPAPTRIALLALVAAGTLAAGAGASGSATPSSHTSVRAMAAPAAHGRKSIRLRDAPLAHRHSGPATAIPDRLGRMPSSFEKLSTTTATSGRRSPLRAGPLSASFDPGLDFNGLNSTSTGFGNFYPPAATGDVGPNGYVPVTNQAWAVF